MVGEGQIPTNQNENAGCDKSKPMKIAILGASGIGKNHARWFHQHGCQVVAFLGSAPETLEKTSQILAGQFPFAGRGYADLAELLEREKPDAVCVSTPNHQHFEHSLVCIEAGVPVLCEKPLVFDKDQSNSKNLERAAQLVEAAKQRGVLLGTQMQYCFAAAPACELTGVAPDEIYEFSMKMETKNQIAGRGFRALWVDLAPHPLSVLQTLAPGARIVSVEEFQCAELRSRADFTLRRKDGKSLKARVEIGCVPDQNPLRRLRLNGRAVDYAGTNINGDFKAKMTTDDGKERIEDDFRGSPRRLRLPNRLVVRESTAFAA